MIGRNHSELTKNKMKGRKHSELTKNRMSEAKKGSNLSEGTKKRIGEAMKVVRLEVLNLESGIKTVYPSISEAQ